MSNEITIEDLKVHGANEACEAIHIYMMSKYKSNDFLMKSWLIFKDRIKHDYLTKKKELERVANKI